MPEIVVSHAEGDGLPGSHPSTEAQLPESTMVTFLHLVICGGLEIQVVPPATRPSMLFWVKACHHRQTSVPPL